jgi:hypothetical protein
MRKIIILSLLFAGPGFAAEPPSTATSATPATKAPAPTSAKPTAKQPTQPAQGNARPAGARAGSDRLNLDTTVVTGNRELPKVLYIVPWKKADLGDLPAQPFNTLLDEVLTPVDRDVFRREVTYYGAIAADGQSGGPTSQSTPAEAPRSEK